MDLIIETRTLYAVSFVVSATELKDYAYSLIIAWGPDPRNKDDKHAKDIIFPWLIDEVGTLEPADDVITVLDYLPHGAQVWQWSGNGRGEHFHDLLTASRKEGQCLS